MKKLIIAMSAATMAALCAQAGQIGITEGFEGRQTKPLDVNEDDTGATTKDTYWSRAEGKTGDSVVTAYKTAPTAGNTKFLSVDETDVLTRSAAKSTEVTADTGVAVSTKVRFTAADQAPTAAPGDKILVWAKAPDEGTDGPAKLMVTALGTDESDTETFGKAKAYDTGVTVTTGDDDWYDLEITAQAADANAASPIVFTVKLDETVIDGSYLSLVLTDEVGDKTISSIGFQGTGKVDDIAFNTVADVPPTTVEVSGTVSGYNQDAKYEVVFQDAAGEDVVAPAVGDTFKVVVTGALATDKVTCEGLTFAYADELWTAEYTVTEADGKAGAKVFTVTVAQGEGPVPTPITPDVTGVPETVTISGLVTSYKAGDMIDPAAISASTSRNGYTVKVTVKVGENAITEATVLKAGDTVTVTAEEVATTYTITYTYVDAEGIAVADVTNENATEFTVESEAITIDTAKISKTGYTVTPVTPSTIAAGTYENQTVTVVLTAIPTYTVTAAAVDGATVTFSTTDAVVSGTTVTFTVAVTDTTKEIDTVKAGETELTANEGVYSVTVNDANIVITVTLKAKQGGETLPTYLEGASEAAKAAYNTWAAANGVVDTASQYEEAFLLNCAPTAVATEKAAFKLSIEMVNGEAVVTTPEGKPYNGKVVIKSYKDVTCTVEGTGEKATFYKATLEVEKAAN